jgi:large subunit ribosomal protein L7e
MASAPETVLKARKNRQEIQARKALHQLSSEERAKVINHRAFERAEKYVKEYREQQANLTRMRRVAKESGSFFREPEAKLAFVIRIRGINGVDPKTRKILRLLRLPQIHNAVFVRLNAATVNMLRLVEPYIAYGYPTLKTVRRLIYKRGFGRVAGQRVPITSNTMIEKALGHHDVICIEDIVNQIYNVGPKFREVNHFLWTFKLNSPKGGFNSVTTHFQEGGDAGNREEKINSLIKRMN